MTQWRSLAVPGTQLAVPVCVRYEQPICAAGDS